MEGLGSREIAKVTKDGVTRGVDYVASEDPISIVVHDSINGETNLGISMRTEGEDRFLILGFLYSEGIIDSIKDVTELSLKDGSAIVTLSENACFHPSQHSRGTTVTSACGLCGRTSIQGLIDIDMTKLDESMTVTLDDAARCLDSMGGLQEIFLRTGGSHACAAFKEGGLISRIFEDVGRHNAFDKLIGSYVDSNELHNTRLGAFVSGRASFELVQKAIRAGFQILFAIGAPSTLAVDLAKEHGLTLGCFAKEDSLTIFSGLRRVSE